MDEAQGPACWGRPPRGVPGAAGMRLRDGDQLRFPKILTRNKKRLMKSR